MRPFWLCVLAALAAGALLGTGSAGAAGSTVAVDRLAGRDKYETAVVLAEAWKAYSNGSVQHNAMAGNIVSGDAWADALSAANLRLSVFYVTASAIPDATRRGLQEELDQWHSCCGSADSSIGIPVVGGTSVIGNVVSDQLTNMGYYPRRIAGADRYATSVRVASEGLGSFPSYAHPHVFLASGESYADAIAIGGVLPSDGQYSVLFLTQRDRVPDVVANQLRDWGARVTIIGGTAAVSSQVERDVQADARIAGVDRFDTAARIADYVLWLRRNLSPPSHVYLANGYDWPDALAATGNVGEEGTVLLLTPPDHLAAATAAWLHDHAASIDRLTAIGPSDQLPQARLDEAAAAVESGK